MAFSITVFSDFVCPFCYIGLAVMRKLKPEFGFDLEWRGFEIHPEWPATGIPAEQVYGSMDSGSPKALWERIAAMGEAAGLEMKPPKALTSSHAALLAAEYARESGRSEEFNERVYRAYFLDGVNIGDPTELKRLGAEAGLDSAAIEGAIHSPAYGLKLKNHALAAHSRGVSGVPTFFIGEFPLVGAQSEDTVRRILERVVERMRTPERS